MFPNHMQSYSTDARSDVFALGAVLYEMATSKRAFEGKTTASVIAAVLERETAEGMILGTFQYTASLPSTCSGDNG